jgi:D-sedoheptulose 7-phosphate isomerase
LRRPYNAGTTADHVVDSLSAAVRLVMGEVSDSNQHVETYLAEVQTIAATVDRAAMARLTDALVALRSRGGRLFLLGVGGSAANASHAANDFRKIAGIEAYCPTDNVAELTARINDDGWDTAYAEWLRGSRIAERDAVFVFSVGGGSPERGISVPLVRAIDAARAARATVLGIVGRDGGYTASVADVCVVVPTVDAARVTPHTESFHAVLWHLLVSHPALQANEMKWESSVSTDARGGNAVGGTSR